MRGGGGVDFCGIRRAVSYDDGRIWEGEFATKDFAGPGGPQQ